MKLISTPENIHRSKRSEQPEIIVFLRPHSSNVQFLMLCIENIGAGAAYNVQFGSGPPGSNRGGVSFLKKSDFLQKGFTCFGPGQKIERFLIDLRGGLPEKLKQPLQISVTYADSLNQRYEKKNVLALGDFEDLAYIDSKEEKAILELIPLLVDVRQVLNQIAERLDFFEQPEISKTMDSKVLSEEVEEHVETVQDDQDKPLAPELEKLVNLYNAGSDTELRENYSPFHSLRVTNETERSQNPNTAPVFETHSNGIFVTYATASENLYTVVPLSGFILQNRFYSSGAFGEVFECPGFNAKHTYHVTLVRPALFKHEPINDEWTLKEKGKLELTQKVT